jgi:hypothetical protein
MRSSFRPLLAGVLTLLLSCLVLLSACSDDPILGPDDGEAEEGGSYSVIKRLAPADTAAARDTAATPLPSHPGPDENPERF